MGTDIILRDTASFVVHHTQIVLGPGKPLFGKGGPFTQSRCIVTALRCGKTFLEIGALTYPHIAKKHSNGKAEHKNSFSHARIHTKFTAIVKRWTCRKTLPFAFQPSWLVSRIF
jgi:hypothetical protein